jgi:hypothetical protein
MLEKDATNDKSKVKDVNTNLPARSKMMFKPKSSPKLNNRTRHAIDAAITHLICPITHTLPIIPVTAEDGQLYDKAAITKWFERSTLSPITKKVIGKKLLLNLQVQNYIRSIVTSGAVSYTFADKWYEQIEKEKREQRKRDNMNKYLQLAEGGDAEAMYKLGEIYTSYDNDEMAFQWYLKAITAGKSMEVPLKSIEALRRWSPNNAKNKWKEYVSTRLEESNIDISDISDISAEINDDFCQCCGRDQSEEIEIFVNYLFKETPKEKNDDSKSVISEEVFPPHKSAAVLGKGSFGKSFGKGSRW